VVHYTVIISSIAELCPLHG